MPKVSKEQIAELRKAEQIAADLYRVEVETKALRALLDNHESCVKALVWCRDLMIGMPLAKANMAAIDMAYDACTYALCIDDEKERT